MFPMVFKDAEASPCGAPLYYEIAANGVFQIRETPLYRAVTRADALPGLLPQHEHVRLRFPRLRRGAVQDVLAFFAEVYRRYGGEAMVVLFCRGDGRELRIDVPQQTLPARRYRDGRWRADHAVVYGHVPRPQGFVRLGTIHSHAGLPAYSSGVDCADERFEDGLHVVFGDFHRRDVSVAATFAANGARFPLPPEQVLERCQVPCRPGRREWMACVHLEKRGGRH